MLVHLGMANMRPILGYRSAHEALENSPEIWNSFCRSSGLSKKKCIAILNNRCILIRSIKRTMEVQTTFKTGQSDMTHMAISNNLIFISSDDQSLRVFDFSGNPVKKFLGHTGGIWTFDMSQKKLVTGSTDKTARVWDLETERTIRVLKYHRSTIRVLRYFNEYIITGSRDHTIGIWNSVGDLLFRLEGHQQSVRCLDVSDEYLVSGSYDGTCKLWDYKRGRFVRDVHIHDRRVYCVKIYNGYVASGGLESDVKISRLDGSLSLSHRYNNSIVGWIDFQDNFVVSSSLDGTVVKYDYVHRRLDFMIQERSPIKSQKVTNSLIIIATSKEVKVYSFNTGLLIRTILKSYMISKVEMDGQRIVAGHIIDGEYKVTVFDYEMCVK